MGLDDVRKRMDSVRDIREGVRWLRENRHVKPEQFAVMGGSYGGFMVLANLAEYPDLWAAGVCRVGIANFISFLENTGPWRRNVREAEYGSLDEDRDFLRRISPTSNADRIQAPLMVIHGENDPRVPVEEAERIVESLKGRQVPVEKLIFPDEGHGIARRENRIRAYRNVDRFLRRHVLRTSTDGREE